MTTKFQLGEIACDNGPFDEIQIRARYVVRMDGGSSFVRQAIGLPMEVLQKHDDERLIFDFDIIDPVLKPPITSVHIEVPRPFYWGHNGAAQCCIDMKLLPGDPDEVRTHAHALEFLQQKAGIAPTSAKITRKVYWG